MVNQLNVFNYLLTDEEGEIYYMTNGLRSLFDLCKGKGWNFRALCLDLNAFRTINLDGIEINVI